MERGGSSNIPHKYTTGSRPPNSGGIVIKEGGRAPVPTAITSIPATDAPANSNPLSPPKSFKRDPDQYMPIANVTRIMRRVLPANAKIADDAKETIQECVSEFIGFITTVANERCHREYRKTVTPEDVLSAMATLGFDNYVESLTVFLNRYRAQEYPERSSSAGQFHLPAVRCGGSYPGQQHMAQMPRPSSGVVRPVRPMPVPPPHNMQDVYVPAPPVMPPPFNAADRGDEYVNLPQLMREYLMGNRGGSSVEGSSSGVEFDPFK